MNITSSEKSQEFVYDFATDGGSVSSIQMGDFIPVHAVIWFGYAKVITTLASAGGATIAIGFAGNTGALINATTFAAFTAGIVITGVNLPIAPVNVTPAMVELSITIAGAPLTAGKLVYTMRYTEWPI